MTAPGNSSKILIVDDVPSNIKTLAAILTEECDISFATSGQEALEFLEDHDVDIILLDIVMPEMSGYSVLERIKLDPRLKDIPVIFLTARSTPEDEVRGLQMGAADYITKPFSSGVVKARVNTQLALQRMNRQLSEITRELIAERQFIEHVVQNMVGPMEIKSPHMSYWMKPVEKTSGDLLMAAKSCDDFYYYFLGDITGHGLSSAVVGPIISYIFYSMAERGSPLRDIINEINQYLYAKLPPNVFLAGCFISMDTGSRRLQTWNCAMPDIIIFRSGRVVRKISSSFQPLGILDCPYGDPELLDLFAEDRLFFLSDGLVEVFNVDGQEFGIDRLVEVIVALVNQNRPLQYVYDQLALFSDFRRQKDDMTIAELVVR